MSLAIKFGDSSDLRSVSGVLYVDAVIRYGREYGGSITSHPLESGAVIADHYISSNRKYNIEGVFSGVDFSPIASGLFLEGEPILNEQAPPPSVNVDSGSSISQILSSIGVIGQYTGANIPEPRVEENPRNNFKYDIENFMEEVLHGLYFNEDTGKLESKMTLVTLFELDNRGRTERVISNLAVTSFSVSEDTETGDALFFTMQLEKVDFVRSERADPPRNSPQARAISDTSNKGSAAGELDAGDHEDPRLTVLGVTRGVQERFR